MQGDRERLSKGRKERRGEREGKEEGEGRCQSAVNTHALCCALLSSKAGALVLSLCVNSATLASPKQARLDTMAESRSLLGDSSLSERTSFLRSAWGHPAFTDVTLVIRQRAREPSEAEEGGEASGVGATGRATGRGGQFALRHIACNKFQLAKNSPVFRCRWC